MSGTYYLCVTACRVYYSVSVRAYVLHLDQTDDISIGSYQGECTRVVKHNHPRTETLARLLVAIRKDCPA